ncbi:NAD-dependent malic enzyme [Epidermidibacterium keratini]|uniref:NAD-dependent malic enzyme n=1 Tax=Epidermidibacterium keratini TaxID=1891644 RepID=A0A7L4YQZ8_9ACTN|nr:NADP-dependent malic enzyme [Epidermidibacterium keratini]QHC01675.1 NAD-dependent malic enzyme [Epidermidibacterium keratini]
MKYPEPPPIDPALQPIFDAHDEGKISVELKEPIAGREDLSKVYTPGVAEVCTRIYDYPTEKRKYTAAPHTVAVVSDGTAVLGLGDIGPDAALPVMEGKACLFKQFAGIDSYPIVLNTKDVDEIIETVKAIAPSFGGINLEDISAPRCFEIEDRLKEELDIPVMHDDQHGTAIVVTAALRNARMLSGRKDGELRIVIAGAGASGIACAKMLYSTGVRDIILTDSKGAIDPSRHDLTPVKQQLLSWTNQEGVRGSTEEILAGKDCFIGLSGATVSEEAIASMNHDPIIFALSNPTPEIHPEIARKYATVVATGRSDFPNQINNVLAFPGIFRGAFQAGATQITEEMKIAAAVAIADVVLDEMSTEKILPEPFDERVIPAVTEAVKNAWLTGDAEWVIR